MEIWKKIDDFPNYEVSNYGNVRTLHYKGTNVVKNLSLNGKDYFGYVMVCLWKNGKSHTKKVHRLVGKAFIPNPDSLLELNHKDEDKDNNSVVNLEWCTRDYNNKYGTHNEKISQTLTNNQYTSKQVYAIIGDKIEHYPSMSEAARQLGGQVGHICDCIKGKRKTHCKRQWFLEE